MRGGNGVRRDEDFSGGGVGGPWAGLARSGEALKKRGRWRQGSQSVCDLLHATAAGSRSPPPALQRAPPPPPLFLCFDKFLQWALVVLVVVGGWRLGKKGPLLCSPLLSYPLLSVPQGLHERSRCGERVKRERERGWETVPPHSSHPPPPPSCPPPSLASINVFLPLLGLPVRACVRACGSALSQEKRLRAQTFRRRPRTFKSSVIGTKREKVSQPLQAMTFGRSGLFKKARSIRPLKDTSRCFYTLVRPRRNESPSCRVLCLCTFSQRAREHSSKRLR